MTLQPKNFENWSSRSPPLEVTLQVTSVVEVHLLKVLVTPPTDWTCYSKCLTVLEKWFLQGWVCFSCVVKPFLFNQNQPLYLFKARLHLQTHAFYHKTNKTHFIQYQPIYPRLLFWCDLYIKTIMIEIFTRSRSFKYNKVWLLHFYNCCIVLLLMTQMSDVWNFH